MKFFTLIFLLLPWAWADDQCLSILSKNFVPIKKIKYIFYQSSKDLCTPLQIGQIKNLNVGRYESPTTVPHKYQLQRITQNDYKIKFNIAFEDSDGEINDNIDPKGESAEATRARAYTYVWSKKANECLEKVKGKLKGPQGENLILEVVGNPPKSTIPKIYVSLKSNVRANSRMWDKQMSCATVLHELLHVTGLVDEYKELDKGLRKNPITGKMELVETNAEIPAYDCRKIAKDVSVMANHEQAWRNAFAPWKSKSALCTCDKDKKLCQKYFENLIKINREQALKQMNFDSDLGGGILLPPSECAPGFKEHPEYQATNVLMDEEKGKSYLYTQGIIFPQTLPDNFWEDKYLIVKFEKRDEKEMNSILNESQWNAIVYPGCFEKNEEYYISSLNAHRTSIKNGGNGCIDMPDKKSNE